jgi:8-oxo-dGTP pyrophosphatase MutT (NUDIX family)
VTAAGREAAEEAGINSDDYVVRDVFSDDHGPWRYDTVIAHCHGDANASIANAESADLHWVHIDSVHTYELHPGFASAWPELHPLVVASLG